MVIPVGASKDVEAGMKALEYFEAGDWGQRYRAITQSRRRNWDHVVPFFVFPESVRRTRHCRSCEPS